MPNLSQQALQAETRTPSPEISLSTRTSPIKLVKIARKFELDKNTAEAEVRDLRRKLADITNQEEDGDDVETPLSKRNRTNDTRWDENEEETQVINAGHCFVMLYSPWLRNGESTFKVEYNPESDEAQRFENADNKIQGQVREIKTLLRGQLSGQMTSETWISKAFTKGMKAQRSNTATRLRRHCAALFGVSESDMLQADVRREKFRARIGWVDNGQGARSYSSVDVEILHKGYSGSYNFQTAFLNPILMWVFDAIIRGPTAAKELMNGITSNPTTDTMARKHGIRHTTPGAIAGTVVLALSADDFLQSVGTNTGINYGKDFEEYLEILIKGLRQRKKTVLNVFREWDRVIFPNSDSSLVGGTGPDQDASHGLKTALDMLEADEVEEEEELNEEDQLNNNNEDLHEDEEEQ